MTMCDGPLIWFDASPSPPEAESGLLPAAILECAACSYLIVTGNWHDERHSDTPLLREGIAT